MPNILAVLAGIWQGTIGGVIFRWPVVEERRRPLSGIAVFAVRGRVPESAINLFERRVHLKALIYGRRFHMVHN